jgi:hypothetical protein
MFPMLHGHLHTHCIGFVTLVEAALQPALQTGFCPVMLQLQHVSLRDIVPVFAVIACGFVDQPSVIPL